ncbi:MAG TPA: hypothetical protein DCS43_08445 [Verrucomicrobia bacterium]|nr:hypothetical protein [Verrucomicrobiota bacterium]
MHVMVAGAGILGRELIKVLLNQGHEVTALALFEREFKGLSHARLHCKAVDVTRAETLHGVADGVRTVISCIGITRVNGKVTHEAVDYQGNCNLLAEAERAGVQQFAIISPEGVELGRRSAPLLQARQKFEKRLQESRLAWLIIHSGGFFSDLAMMAQMAQRSPMFVIGRGVERFTPIAVADLAQLVTEEIGDVRARKVHVGGPETLSWNAIMQICFAHWNLPARIYHIPRWLCQLALVFVRPFSARYYSMGKLLVFMYTHDLPTPERGKTTLREYLKANVKAT